MSNESQKQILSELQAQNSQYTDAYWDIFNNKEAVPADQQERMRAELLKNYARTVALLDGQAGLEKEREIAKLELERLEIKEKARLREAEIEQEYRLKHVELKERADTKAARLTKEFEIKRKAESETLEIKAAQIVPTKEELPKRWWQRRTRYFTNYAYELASKKAELEAEKYLTARENEIIKLEAEQSGTDELEIAVMKVMTDYTGGKTRGRKAKAINQVLSGLIEPLCGMFARRERELNRIIERLNGRGDKASDEPSEHESKSVEEHDFEEEREKLQSHAASLLAAFCQKRIDELQQEQLKPKRKRIRKTRPENKGGINL